MPKFSKILKSVARILISIKGHFDLVTYLSDPIMNERKTKKKTENNIQHLPHDFGSE